MVQQIEKIIGAKYSGGNILLKHGILYFSVGKYVSTYDYTNLRSEVLQIANSTNISILSMSSCGKFLLTVDFLGCICILNLQKKVTIMKINTRERVLDVKFSTGSNFFAVVRQGRVDVWALQLVGLNFEKVSLYKTFAVPLSNNNRSLSWSLDDSCIILGCEDYACRIFELRNQVWEGEAEVLVGQKENIIDTHISNDMSTTYCVTRNGTLLTWSKIKEKWRIKEVKKINSSSLVSTSCFNRENSLLVVGFDSFFVLYDIHMGMQLQKIALVHHSLNYCNFSDNGEVILFGSGRNGQISLWEWREEMMICKYEGHQQSVRTCAFSTDGSLIATGSVDFKVKVWNYNSGACVATFSEHLMPVTAVTFTTGNHVVISASLDGTVRAFDLIRHRNFRIFVGDESGQYSCLAVDSSGEMVCAGTCDTSKIFLWSLKSGRLLDVFVGHEAPVSGLHFNYSNSVIISGSWDKSIRFWDIYDRRNKQTEVISLFSDITCLDLNSYNSHLAVASIDGNISIICSRTMEIVSSFDASQDIKGTRDHRDANMLSLSYNMDGDLLLACSYFHIYTFESSGYTLLRRCSAGNWIQMENLCNHSTKFILSIKCSPVKQCWAASTTNGLYVFAEESFRKGLFEVGKQIKCIHVIEMITTGSYCEAVSTALGLKFDFSLLQSILCSIPQRTIRNVIKMLPQEHIVLLLEVLQSCLSGSKHLAMTLSWLHRICLTRCEVLSALPLSSLTHILGQVSDLHHMESWNISRNKYALDFVCEQI